MNQPTVGNETMLNHTKHVSVLYITCIQPFYSLLISGVVLSQQHNVQRTRDDENELADLGIEMPCDFHMRLWLNRPLDVRALITPPIHEFSSGCYLLCIDTYYTML